MRPCLRRIAQFQVSVALLCRLEWTVQCRSIFIGSGNWTDKMCAPIAPLPQAKKLWNDGDCTSAKKKPNEHFGSKCFSKEPNFEFCPKSANMATVAVVTSDGWWNREFGARIGKANVVLRDFIALRSHNGPFEATQSCQFLFRCSPTVI